MAPRTTTKTTTSGSSRKPASRKVAQASTPPTPPPVPKTMSPLAPPAAPDLRITISGVVCYPKVNEDVQLFNGTTKLTMTLQGNDFVYSLPSGESAANLEVRANAFTCSADGGVTYQRYEPKVACTPVTVTAGTPSTEEVKYESKPDLTISFAGVSSCYPEINNDVQLFDADGKKRTLTPHGYDFVYSLPPGETSAPCDLVANWFTCTQGDDCYHYKAATLHTPVLVSAGGNDSETITYLQTMPDLRIEIVVDDGDYCRPEPDVYVKVANVDVPLKDCGNYLVGNLPPGTYSALLEVVALPFTCDATCRTSNRSSTVR